jgi:hypothetical protein
MACVCGWGCDWRSGSRAGARRLGAVAIFAQKFCAFTTRRETFFVAAALCMHKGESHHGVGTVVD